MTLRPAAWAAVLDAGLAEVVPRTSEKRRVGAAEAGRLVEVPTAVKRMFVDRQEFKVRKAHPFGVRQC